MLVNPESVQRFVDKQEDVETRIIEAVGKVGPRNIAEISRITRVHPETIRYKFGKRFSRLGLRFHAEVDYQRLGLNLRWGTFQFSPSHYEKAPLLFRLLNRFGYLNYFGKIVPSGHYMARFGVPNRMQKEHEALFSWLMKEGVILGFTLQDARISRHVTMSPGFFNFKSGRWEIPWKELRNLPPRPLPVTGRGVKYLKDYDDLLIMKELQKDSMQHITSIARKLKINGRTLEYHYRVHVIGQGLVRSYFVRWAQDTSKTLVHSVALTRLVFHTANGTELREVQAVVSKIPFLWMEDLMEDGTYVASMYVPSTDTLSLFGYLNDELGELGPRVETGFVKTSEASSFTIPYEMWQNGEWSFEASKMKAAILKEYHSTPQK